MDAYQILVVVLSTVLAIFLILSIVLVVTFIKIAKRVRKITDRAEGIVDEVGAASTIFRKSANAVTMAGVVGNIIEKVSKTKDKKKEK